MKIKIKFTAILLFTLLFITNNCLSQSVAPSIQYEQEMKIGGDYSTSDYESLSQVLRGTRPDVDEDEATGGEITPIGNGFLALTIFLSIYLVVINVRDRKKGFH